MEPNFSWLRSDCQWFAVRCCCGPSRIFGFIKLPVGMSEVKLIDFSGVTHSIRLQRLQATTGSTIQAETAVYSEDRPIEFWRTIPNFIEAA